MLGSLEWWVASRYVFSRKRERFTGLIANISILAVTIGVAALIVVIAVMTGFQSTLKEKLLSITPHIMIEKVSGPFIEYEKLADKLRRWLEKEKVPISTLYPFLSLQGMLLSGTGEAGVVLKGIPPDRLSDLKNLKLLQGTLALKARSPYPVLLGKRLAARLGVKPGDRLRFLSPRGRATPLGFMPRSVPLKVAGIFETGLYEYDLTLVLIDLKAAQKILGGSKQVTGIELRLEDPFFSSYLAPRLSRELGYSYYVVDWQTLNRSLFSALKLEKAGMFVVLTLIVVVAAFNIIAALVMLISEKRPDIALMKALGATERLILKIFLYCGLLLGVSGTLLGTTLGLTLCALLSRYPIIKLPEDVYPMEYLPIKVEMGDVTLIIFSALILSLLAAAFPARQAAKLPPAEVLRYG